MLNLRQRFVHLMYGNALLTARPREAGYYPLPWYEWWRVAGFGYTGRRAC